jgi:hypothetical protein
MLANRVRFAISSGRVDPETGMPVEDANWYAMTVLSQERGNRLGREVGESTIFVAYEHLSPMLFGDLTPSEMLISQFEIGIAILQELAHLVHQQTITIKNPVPEPIYDYERAPALGKSLMHMVTSGQNIKVRCI